MPRPGPRRLIVGVRLSFEDRSKIEARAKRAGVSMSEMIRRLIAYALDHLQEGEQ